MNRKKYNPVRSISLAGKLLTGLVRFLFHIRRFFGGKDWDRVWPEHHEDPLYMKGMEQLYFGHKYYYRALTKAEEGSGLEKHFRENAGKLNIPDDFIAEQQITLSAGGDLMPYFCINKDTCENLWDECGDFFFGADIITANLETPIVRTKKVSLVPEVMLNHMFFNGNDEMYDVFSGFGKYKNYDVLALANNHSLDQGESGLLDTIAFLEEQKVAYCGVAKTEATLNDFPIIEKEGIKIAFLSATFSMNTETLPEGKEWMVNHLPLNRENPNIQLLIKQAKIARKKGADFIIAHLHMGCAYQPYPSKHSVVNIRTICEKTGIDIVLGGHPHNPQPIEFHNITDPFTKKKKQSFIVYSMGDFVAYDIFKWCHLPMMLKFTIGKNKEQTFITKIEIKLAYMQATIKNGEVKHLQFRDFKKLMTDSSSLDKGSKKEFEELKDFAQDFLLPGNVKRYLC